MKIVIVVALIAVALSTSESCQLCPAFWVPFQSNCYRIFGFKLTWSQAEERCNTYFNGFAMGHLVSIRSEDENRFVSKLWNSATGGMVAVADYTYWIGLTDGETEGTWLWSDDDPVDYTIWHAGQPDNYSGNEDCVHLWNRDTANVTWNDASCSSQKLFYVCELPQNRQ